MKVDNTHSLDRISRLGLGAWAIGGPYEFGWGPVDDSRSMETISAACDQGINWIDTAPAYGYGHSEEVIGRMTKTLSGSVMIFTKCGRVWDSNGKVSSDLRPESIRNQWQQSTSRLGVEVIDLYQVHRPDTVTGTPLAKSWETLVKLRDEGKVKAIGLSNVTLTQYRECAAIGRVDSLQMPVNLLRAGDVDLRMAAEAGGTIVLAYSPMESGLLTGKFDNARVEGLPSDDWRKKSAKFSPESLDKASQTVDALAKMAARTGYSVPSLAVAWALRQRGVTSAIVGARYPEQITDWLAAPLIYLPVEEWADVDALTKML
jgi:aryl-alcohol dehydrogenase-like predicted oxidoreductase